jgi:hypothetical protein
MIAPSVRSGSSRRGVSRRVHEDARLLAQLVHEELRITSLENWGRLRPWKDATRRLVEIRRPHWLDAPRNAYWFAHTLWSRYEIQTLAQAMLDEVAEHPELFDSLQVPSPETFQRLASLVIESVDCAALLPGNDTLL